MKVSTALSQRLFISGALLLFLVLAVGQAMGTGGEGATADQETEPVLPCPGAPGEVDKVRKTWPELVGVPAKKAAEKIRAELPWIFIAVIPPGVYVTMDYNQCRVRLFVNDAGIVIRVPMVG